MKWQELKGIRTEKFDPEPPLDGNLASSVLKYFDPWNSEMQKMFIQIVVVLQCNGVRWTLGFSVLTQSSYREAVPPGSAVEPPAPRSSRAPSISTSSWSSCTTGPSWPPTAPPSASPSPSPPSSSSVAGDGSPGELAGLHWRSGPAGTGRGSASGELRRQWWQKANVQQTLPLDKLSMWPVGGSTWVRCRWRPVAGVTARVEEVVQGLLVRRLGHRDLVQDIHVQICGLCSHDTRTQFFSQMSSSVCSVLINPRYKQHYPSGPPRFWVLPENHYRWGPKWAG